jgi:hypothetical protein
MGWEDTQRERQKEGRRGRKDREREIGGEREMGAGEEGREREREN